MKQPRRISPIEPTIRSQSQAIDEDATVEAVAVALRCSPATVWRLARHKSLTHRRRLGRTVFDWTEVRKLATERGASG
jgi:hypothetical protein